MRLPGSSGAAKWIEALVGPIVEEDRGKRPRLLARKIPHEFVFCALYHAVQAGENIGTFRSDSMVPNTIVEIHDP